MNPVYKYKIGKALYFITLFLFLLALVLTKFDSVSSNIIFIVTLGAFFIGTFLLCFGRNKIDFDTGVQLCFVVFPVTIFWILTLRKNIIHQMPYNAAIAYTGCVVLLLSAIFILQSIIPSVRFAEIKNKFITFWAENYYIIPIIIIYTLCYIPCFFLLFKSDSNTYYLSIVQNQGGWNFTLNNLNCFKMGYHLTYGYSLYAFLGNYLCRVWGIGIRFVNLLFVYISIFCINDIIKKIMPQSTRLFRAMILCLFAYNPLFLGIIQELNIDMPMACFFIWFVWAYMNKKRIYTVYFSCLLCFSKEIGIVLLAGFITGTFFWRILQNFKNITFKNIIKCYAYYEWLISFAPLLFVTNMLFLNNKWGEKTVSVPRQLGLVNSLQLNPEYIIIKLQQIFILNFQWVIIPIICLFLVKLFTKKTTFKLKESITGIICSYIFFLIFQLLYFTYPHYRYLQVNAFFDMLFIGCMINYVFSRETIKSILCGFIAILFFIQSFYYIDILSNALFRSINIGNGNILSLAYYCDAPDTPYILWSEKEGADLSNEKFRDYVQNNRQYLGFEYCFEKLLAEIQYNESVAIILSPIYSDAYWGNETWTIVNMFGVYDKSLLHWNTRWKQITYEPTDIPLNFISPNSIHDQTLNYESIWYIELPYETQYNTFPIECIITDQITVRYFNWFLNAYKLQPLKTEGK